MIYAVEQIESEFEKVMDGYTGLLTVRLQNLCVKSHPMAMIPVIVEVAGQENVLEDVAECAIPDDDHIEVYPKNEDYFLAVVKGVMETHPEFQAEEKNTKVGDSYLHYLSFKIPPVNKDRRDVLLNGVDVFYQEAKAQYEATKGKYTVKLTQKLTDVQASKEDVDEYKKRNEETYDNHKKLAEDTVNDKKKEIEDAYQRYLQNQDASEQASKEQQAAEGKEVKSSIQMPTFEQS